MKRINNHTEKQSVYINKKATRSISSLERKKYNAAIADTYISK